MNKNKPYSIFILFIKYCKYMYIAKTKHGVHSPFVFDFVTKALNKKQDNKQFDDIELYRKAAKKDKTIIKVHDYGAKQGIYTTTISKIANNSLKNRSNAQLLFKIFNYFKPQDCIELGTSLGISTLYISKAISNSKITSIEGCINIASYAKELHLKHKTQNITVVSANINDELSNILREKKFISSAFIDANHTKEATIKYFEEFLPFLNETSFLVFDDIHWSKDMEEAWNHIITNEKVSISIDLFFFGIVFFRKGIEKQNFILRHY